MGVFGLVNGQWQFFVNDKAAQEAGATNISRTPGAMKKGPAILPAQSITPTGWSGPETIPSGGPFGGFIPSPNQFVPRPPPQFVDYPVPQPSGYPTPLPTEAIIDYPSPQPSNWPAADDPFTPPSPPVSEWEKYVNRYPDLFKHYQENVANTGKSMSQWGAEHYGAYGSKEGRKTGAVASPAPTPVTPPGQAVPSYAPPASSAIGSYAPPQPVGSGSLGGQTIPQPASVPPPKKPPVRRYTAEESIRGDR